ncbi:MAG: zf-HC2 domain-containing protein [Acidimicrobiia bacterium]|nr:zf-HC2 domain-containing protein [Acidimicrobiia bacterium]
MSCQAFEVLIGDAGDGGLDAAARQRLDAHLAVCPACRQMAEDFAVIRLTAGALDRPVPSPQVWTRIAAEIDGGSARGSDPVSRPVSGGLTLLPRAWPQFVAAAAGVVLATGIAWMAWRDPGSAAHPNPPAIVARPDSDVDVDPDQELKLAEDHYVSAISGLEEITRTSSEALDPETAGVLQANLTVIDQAIGESRAALQQEPASEQAQASLFEALRDKVALLQDAVALINEMRTGNAAGAARIVSGLNQ